MRKLTSKKEEQAREKKRNLIMTIALTVILLMSIGGYSFMGGDSSSSGESKSINYNEIEFYNSNDYWIANNKNNKIVLKNNPNNLDNIDFSTSIRKLDNYYNKPLYIYSENSFARQEIYNNLHPGNNDIVQRLQEACIENETCEKDLPIKDCRDNIIIIKESLNMKIYQRENCVFIQGNSTEIIRATDKFLLYLMGIN